MPYLDRVVEGLTRPQVRSLCLTLAALFSVLPLFSPIDLFQLNNGYSLPWLAALYVLGACLKKEPPPKPCRPLPCAVLALLCIAAAWAGKLLSDAAFLSETVHRAAMRLLGYTSPLMLAAAVFLLLAFAALPFRRPAARRVVAFFAPLSFGVYLIHANAQVWNHLLLNAFTFLSGYTAPLMVCGVLLCAAAVYLGCSLVDFLRLQLFRLWDRLRPARK